MVDSFALPDKTVKTVPVFRSSFRDSRRCARTRPYGKHLKAVVPLPRYLCDGSLDRHSNPERRKLTSYQERSSGPISRDTAILSLRYPLSRDTSSAIPAIPQQDAIPPFGAFFFTKTYQCDTPFCNISRDTCAIPQENKHEKVLRYYR